jgi:transposase
MIRRRDAAGLDAWLDEASAGPMASFARGLRDDQSAVAAALSLPWSNGQTEGQITKLKLVKRQMYGRAKLDPVDSSAKRNGSSEPDFDVPAKLCQEGLDR